MSVPPSPPPGPGDPSRPGDAFARTSGRRLPARWRELVAGTVGALVVAAYVAVSVFVSTAPDPERTTRGDAPIPSIPRVAAPATPEALRPYTVGSRRAPLHLVEYADFRCLGCGIAVDDELADVLVRWLDAGRLRLSWRDLATLGPESVRAARAAHAAARQDRFWPMYEQLFRSLLTGKPRVTTSGLVRMADRAGVADLTRFRRDLASGESRRFVARSGRIARARGLALDPSYTINGARVLSADIDGPELERLLQDLWKQLGPAATPDREVPPEAVTASGPVDRGPAADHGNVAVVAAANAGPE